MTDTNQSAAADAVSPAEALAPNAGMLGRDVLSILRCPVTHSTLRQEGDWLIADKGGLAYPVRDGIPVMLAEEAKLPAGVATLDEFKARFSTR